LEPPYSAAAAHVVDAARVVVGQVVVVVAAAVAVVAAAASGRVVVEGFVELGLLLSRTPKRSALYPATALRSNGHGLIV